MTCSVGESRGPKLTQTMADFCPIITIDPTIPFPPTGDIDGGKATPIGMIGMAGSSRSRISTAALVADDIGGDLCCDADGEGYEVALMSGSGQGTNSNNLR